MRSIGLGGSALGAVIAVDLLGGEHPIAARHAHGAGLALAGPRVVAWAISWIEHDRCGALALAHLSADRGPLL